MHVCRHSDNRCPDDSATDGRRTQGIGEWARGWVFFANAEFYKTPHMYLSSALANSPLAHGWIGECDQGV